MLEGIAREIQQIAEAMGDRLYVLALRPSIEHGSGYGAPDDITYVVRYFCDVVEFACNDTQLLAPSKARGWLRSSNPILHRIGLYYLRLTVALPSSEKLTWVVSEELLFSNCIGAEGDIYAVVGNLYPSLTATERAELWQVIETGPSKKSLLGISPERKKDYADRCVSKLVRYIHHHFSTDSLAVEAFARLQQSDPAYSQVPYQDLNLEGELGVVREGLSSPITPEELLAARPDQHLHTLLTYRGSNDPFEDTWEGLMVSAGKAANKSPSWGMELLRLLAAGNHWEKRLWGAVLWQLPFEKLEEADQLWVISVADRLSDKPEVHDGLSYCLYGRPVFSQAGRASSIVLEALLSSSVKLWETIHNASEPSKDDLASTEWMQRAINRPAGRLVEFWVNLTSDHLRQANSVLRGWPKEFAGILDAIMEGSTEADVLGRVVLASHLGFARYVAHEWTRRHLYPWLDFAKKGDWAWPAFRAMLFHCRFNRDLMIELPAILSAAAPYCRKAGGDVSRRFLKVVALAVYCEVELSGSTAWLRGILSALPEERATFAAGIRDFLYDLNPEERGRFWRRWMLPYWEQRLVGKPFALTPSELGVMVGWIWRLTPADFVDATSLLLRSPKPTFEECPDLDLDDNSDLPKQAPEALLDVWRWQLEACQHAYVDPKECRVLLANLPVDPQLLTKWKHICNLLTKLGKTFAADLLKEGEEHFLRQVP